MVIDIDKFKEDLLNESYGAAFGGGFGGALMEAVNLQKALAEELVRIAQNKGVDLRKYEEDRKGGYKCRN